MSNRKLNHLTSGLVLLALPITTQQLIGELAPDATLSASVQSADVIVIARATSSVQTLSPVTMTVNLSILDTLKGADIPKEVTITFAARGYARNWGPLRTSTRLVFLQRRGGALGIPDPSYVSLPAVESPLPDGNDPLSAVISEEKQVLASSEVSESEKREAINSLGTSLDPRATVALRQALSDPAKDIQLEAISRLAQRGDATSLSSAADTLIAPPQNLPEFTLQSLRVGIREGARTEAFVPRLAELLNAKENETREAAAEALRHIGSQSSREPLVRALSDSDQWVRYQAVVGLATMVGDHDYLPNIPDFRKDELKYTTHWKQWASTH